MKYNKLLSALTALSLTFAAYAASEKNIPLEKFHFPAIDDASQMIDTDALFVPSDADWNTIPNQPLGVGGTNVLAIGPSSELYAATSIGLFTSTDNTTWTNITPRDLADNGGAFVTSLVVDAENEILYIGTALTYLNPNSATLYKYDIKTKTWTDITMSDISFASVYTLTLDTNGNLYVGLDSYYGVSVYANNQWTNLPKFSQTEGNPSTIYSLISNQNVLYAGTTDGVYAFQNNTWSAIAEDQLTDINIYSMALDTANNFLYMGTAWSEDNKNVYQYDVSTKTLNAIPVTNFTDATIYTLTVDATGNLYAGTDTDADNGLFFLPAGETTWEPLGAFADGNPYIRSILVNTDTLLVGSDNGIFQSTDNGNDWDLLVQSDFTVSTLLVGTNGTVYLGTDTLNGTNIYAYDPTLETWNNISNPYFSIHTMITSLAIDAQGNLYAGANSSDGIFMLPAGGTGQDWIYTNTMPGGNPNSVHQLLINGATLYAATSNGVYTLPLQTTEGRWANILPRVDTYSLAIDTSNPEAKILYAGTYYGNANQSIYQYNFAQESWTNISPTLTDSAGVSALVVDSNSNLYAAINANGDSNYAVYKLAPGGEWSSTALPLAQQPIYSLVIHNDNLYAAQLFGGVFESTDGNVTWDNFNTGLTSPVGVGALAVDDNNSKLYAGYALQNLGVFSTDL